MASPSLDLNLHEYYMTHTRHYMVCIFDIHVYNGSIRCTYVYTYTSCHWCTIYFILTSYPDHDQLQTVYGTYLHPVLDHALSAHPVWGHTARVHTLASSMVQVYEQVYTCTCLLIHVLYL